MMRAAGIAAAALLALGGGPLAAQPAPARPGDVQIPPPPRGFGTSAAEVVVDAANVLSAATEDRINRLAFDVHAKSGGEIAVVTLPDIGQREPSDVALRVGREWGVGEDAAIGQTSRNAGIVVLVVPKETSGTGRGRCRVEVGRGAEGFLTDGDAAAICRAATPLFAQQNYSSGVEQVVASVAREYARAFNFQLDTALAAPPPPSFERGPAQVPPGRRGGGGLISFLFSNPLLLFLLLFFILPMLFGGGRRGRRRGGCGGPGCLPVPIIIPGGGYGGHRGGFGGGWSGGGGFGGGGGGFGGFGGGGGFSGGGGGSDW